jgi:hypothetical protein
MKTATRILAPLAVLAVSASAAPFLAIGDGAELFLTTAAAIKADDNIYLGNNATSDTVMEFAPGVDVVFGNGSITKGHIYAKESWTRYLDESHQNNNLSSIGIDGSYDDKKTKVTFNASFDQIAQNTVDVNADFMVRRDVTKVGTTGEISATEKTSLGLGFTYEDTNYRRRSFTDSRVSSIPLNAFYQLTPKLDLSGGITYRETRLDNSDDSRDIFYNVGARGEFGPKLTGKIAVGLTQRKFDAATASHGKSESAFGLQSSLTYAVTEKTSVNVGASNDFGVNGQGGTQRNFSINAGVNSKLAEDWSVGANVSLRTIHTFDTIGGTDDYLEGSLKATYIMNAIVSFTGSYTYRNYDSTVDASSFSNNVFGIAANIRY